MKTINTIIKLVAALAAVIGFIYVCATYGDKIVAWAKEMLAKCPCKCDDADEVCEEACEEAVEAAEEAPAEEEAPVEAAVEEAVIDPSVPVADEADFEG